LQGGQTLAITSSFSDYQATDGIMFPMTISQSFGPQAIDFKVTEVVVNPTFTAADFE